ncbi:MAG: YbaB/EbfC family nucleoid-associated protein [Deltaproteobacteria bacterium]
MEHAQGLQSKIAALQDELADKTVTGSSGGGMVVVEANGAQEITSIKIEQELISSDDTEMMEDLLVADRTTRGIDQGPQRTARGRRKDRDTVRVLYPEREE